MERKYISNVTKFNECNILCFLRVFSMSKTFVHGTTFVRKYCNLTTQPLNNLLYLYLDGDSCC